VGQGGQPVGKLLVLGLVRLGDPATAKILDGSRVELIELQSLADVRREIVAALGEDSP
jgi:hypothetical protein